MRPRLLRVEDAAALLCVSRKRVYELCEKDILPVVRLGRTVRIDAEKLDRFLDSGGAALPGGWKAEADENAA